MFLFRVIKSNPVIDNSLLHNWYHISLSTYGLTDVGGKSWVYFTTYWFPIFPFSIYSLPKIKKSGPGDHNLSIAQEVKSALGKA